MLNNYDAEIELGRPFNKNSVLLVDQTYNRMEVQRNQKQPEKSTDQMDRHPKKVQQETECKIRTEITEKGWEIICSSARLAVQ